MNAKVMLRYADPETVPAHYAPHGTGVISSATMVGDDWWVLRGPQWALGEHLKEALGDNNLNDYRWLS